MESEEDKFEEEEEDLKEEIKEETSKPKVKASKVKTDVEDKKPQEKYVPFYQEQRIGIMNTLTGKIEQEGFENPTLAQSQAKILNMLDKISITTGA